MIQRLFQTLLCAAVLLFAATGAASAQDAAEPAPAAGEAELDALIEVLRDEEARARLLAELEKISAEDAEPAAAVEPAPEATPEDPSFGRHIADATRDGAEAIADWGEGFLNAVLATQRRLGGFAKADTDAILAALEDIATVLVITVLTFVLLNFSVRPLRLRLGRPSAQTGLVYRAMLTIAAIGLSLAVLLVAWAAGQLIALFVLPPVGELVIAQVLYLNAFLTTGLGFVALRAIFAPTAGRLRFLPMEDATTRYWFAWTTALAYMLGYGLMLVVPIVNETVSIFTGRATAVLIYCVVLLLAAILVIRHRRDPYTYYRRRAEESGGDVTLSTIAFFARFWHWVVIAYLLLLFVFAVTEAGRVGPVLLATLKILAAVGAGMFTTAVLAKASQHGVRMPELITARLPLIEKRVNTFVPGFLAAVRFAILLVVVLFSIDVIGIADVERQLLTLFGVDLTTTLVSVGLILLVAFLAWLALSSWVDYRLTPKRGRIVTPREQTLLTLLRNAASIAIIIVTAMFALSEIGIDIAPLIASAGVLGLAIGFGAQKLVQDIITGIFIQLENAMNVGDWVDVAGVSGEVEKLTIRSVSLRDIHGTFHIVPFSSVDAVANYMRGFGFHLANIGIAYRESIDEAKAIIFEVFDELKASEDFGPGIIGELEWWGVTALGDSAVNLRCRIKAKAGRQWGVGRAFTELLKKRFDEAGIEIPFPHMTVWFGEDKQGSAPPAHLRFARDTTERALPKAPVPSGITSHPAEGS